MASASCSAICSSVTSDQVPRLFAVADQLTCRRIGYAGKVLRRPLIGMELSRKSGTGLPPNAQIREF
jgi:hypothetical protein